jgi:hypothetical protein
MDADGSGSISKEELLLWFLKVEPQNSLQFTAYTDSLMEKLP